MNKKNYWFENRGIIITAICFFIICFVVLTVAVRIEAEDTTVEFELEEGATTVDLTINTKLKNGEEEKAMANIGYKMGKLKMKCVYDDSETCEENKGNEDYWKERVDYIGFTFSDDSYSIKSLSESQAEATQMKTNSSGKINIKGIPEGEYIIYESEMPYSQIYLIEPIYLELTKDDNNSNKLNVSVSSTTKGIKITKDDNNTINVEILHEKTNKLSASDLPSLSCIKAVTHGNIVGTSSDLKISKEVYPPSIDDWSVNLKVAAYINLPNYGGLTNTSFKTLEDYASEENGDNYYDYLEENYSAYYNAYYDEYENYVFDEYEDEFKEYCGSYSVWVCRYKKTLKDYYENGGFEYYWRYLKQHYEDYYYAYYDEYEKYLTDTYGKEYQEYLENNAENLYRDVTLSKSNGNVAEINDTVSFGVCFDDTEVGRAPGDLIVDIIEEDHDDYDISYSSNMPGLKQEGNRFYGTVRNAMGHEVTVKIVNWDKNYGDLQISKKLFSDTGLEETGKDFKFKIVLTSNGTNKLEDKYNYTVNGDSTYNTLEFTTENDNTKSVVITIKAGDTIRLIGIPTGTTYTITEEQNGEYEVNPKNDKGTIIGADIQNVFFTNTKKNTGMLTVTKNVVAENNINTKQEFKFKVILSDKNINGKYGEMEFKDGVATFTLKHDESITAINIPKDITYEVKEESTKGYEMVEENTKGTIEEGVIKEVIITNVKTNDEMPPNTSNSIIVAVILLFISLGTLIYFQINKKFMM